MIGHVIVQAGGIGSRMGKNTFNNPKCLVSLGGVNILQSVNLAFSKAKIYVVGDYKFDVLKSYLEVIDHGLEYELIHAKGKGTNAGLREIAGLVPPSTPIAVTWSDLFYTRPLSIPTSQKDYIVLTDVNECRYKYEKLKFREEKTTTNGVIGLFIFKDKGILERVPDNGEFVKFLSANNVIFEPLKNNSIIEIGTSEKLEYLVKNTFNTRFFNKLEVKGSLVIKQARNDAFSERAKDEIEWYKYMVSHRYSRIPEIFSYYPLTMKKVNGKHPFQIRTNQNEKETIISDILRALKDMHKLEAVPASNSDLYETYVEKTLQRIVPVSNLLNIRGGEIFYLNDRRVIALSPKDKEMIENIVRKLKPIKYFHTIHGDPTFSNILLNNNLQPIFIDPRGYFGRSKIFGDTRYDFAKVYYSAIGDYDQLNLQNYILKIDHNIISLKVASSGFKETEDVFEEELKGKMKDVKILHSLIWISLSGYLMNDINSMIASYFRGLELLNELGDEYGLL